MSDADGRARFRAGLRDGAPFAGASAVLAVSFGVVATGLGLSAPAAIVMSAVVFAGAAQFAALAIVAAGGGLAAAVGAAVLINSRFLPMGFAIGPSLRGRPWRRAVEGQVVVDSSWAMASRGDGTFERLYLFGHTGVQYVAWVLGTAVGALGPHLDDRALGLDAVFPAFFLVVLAGELRDPARRPAALVGGLVALALVPVAPVGVPVLAAGLGALVGRRRAAR